MCLDRGISRRQRAVAWEHGTEAGGRVPNEPSSPGANALSHRNQLQDVIPPGHAQ